MKSKIICVAAGIAAGALIMFIVMVLIGNKDNDTVQRQDSNGSSVAAQAVNNTNAAGGETTAAKDTSAQPQETTSAKDTGAQQTETAGTGTQPQETKAPAVLAAGVDAVKSNSWESGGKFYSQYDITVTNEDSMVIDGWTVVFDKADRAVTGNWNCEVEESGGRILIKPVEFNKKIEPGAFAGGAGIIVESGSSEEISDFTVITEGSSDIGGTSVQSAPQPEEKPKGTEQTATPQTPAETTKLSVRPAEPVGRLHVEGTQLVNENGAPVQLRGVSTHGLSWYPEYVNREAFATLRDDWNANVVRLAMYTAEYGGYCSGGDRDKLKSLIDEGVNYATSLGMYVIIDWHILSDNNPQTNKSDAIAFFKEMSAKYADYDNVIYEICNEPHWVNWNNDIRPYANEVISAIRENDKNAVILVGTNTWSQDVDDVIGNRVDDDNVMYVLHFYAATHKGDLRSKLINARNAGIPIFVSECSICDASGNGGIDYASADEWLNLMNENNISFIAWSLSNKAETSALIRSDCNKYSGWEESDLTDTGKWFRNAIRSR